MLLSKNLKKNFSNLKTKNLRFSNRGKSVSEPIMLAEDRSA